MTRPEAMQLLAVLKAAYPRQPIEAATVEAYAEMLRDLDAEACARAVRAHIVSSPYFPTIAEIRRAVAEEAAQLPTPEQAWAMVAAALDAAEFAVNFPHGFALPRLAHPLVAAAAEDIGWSELVRSPNPSATRAQFLQQYAARRADALRPYLHGEIAPVDRPAWPQATLVQPRRSALPEPAQAEAARQRGLAMIRQLRAQLAERLAARGKEGSHDADRGAARRRPARRAV